MKLKKIVLKTRLRVHWKYQDTDKEIRTQIVFHEKFTLAENIFLGWFTGFPNIIHEIFMNFLLELEQLLCGVKIQMFIGKLGQLKIIALEFWGKYYCCFFVWKHFFLSDTKLIKFMN